MTDYDVKALRSHFPALAQGVAHFDGPGGSQVPTAVADAVASAMTCGIANRTPLTAAGRRAEAIVGSARVAVGDLLGADPAGVVFGRSMTALTFELSRVMARTWAPGDEVVVTRLDHDANITPWVLAAASVGAVVRTADFDPATGELPVDAVAGLIGPRTRLVAVTAASNLIGTRPDVASITGAARAAGALSYVDGVHHSAHCPVDVAALGADLYACSPYKWMGPHCGVVVAAPGLLEDLHPDKLAVSADAVPERFELGTLPYELLAGVTAAVDFVAGIAAVVGAPSAPGTARRARVLASMAQVEAHEDRLRGALEDRLDAAGGITRHGRAASRTPTLLLSVAGTDPAAVAGALAARGVNAPAGSFYAVEASRHLGLGDAGGLRVGLAPYTDDDDVERLVGALGG